MAVAGSGGWVPSVLVKLDRRRHQLDYYGLTHNVPREHVFADMALAADAIRDRPERSIRIDARGDCFTRLRDYLVASGHVSG